MKISLEKVIRTDYVSNISFLIPTFFGVLYFLFPKVSNQENPQGLIYLIFPIAFASLFLLLWRIKLINNTFESGVEADGTINESKYYGSNWRITYSYSYQGKEYSRSNWILRNRYSHQLQSNQKQAIIVNVTNPKLAFIRDLYIKL